MYYSVFDFPSPELGLDRQAKHFSTYYLSPSPPSFFKMPNTCLICLLLHHRFTLSAVNIILHLLETLQRQTCHIHINNQYSYIAPSVININTNIINLYFLCTVVLFTFYMYIHPLGTADQTLPG